jgi:two-component system chemotaxis sensor kinase CheA
MTDKSLIEDFADEAREHLEEVESSLLRLASDPANRELLDTIFRSMHTIKGASEYLGFERTARLSHRLENLLDLIREGQLQADKVTIDLLIDAQDRISDLVSQVETSGHETAEIDDLLDRVSVVSSESKTPDDEAEAAAVYEDETDKELFGIFIEQLSAGIGQLVETCGRLARKEAGPEAVDEMAGQVERLAATANYMGYDALSVIYEDLQAAITKFSSRSAYAGATEIEAFIQTSIVSGIDRIKELFPDVKPLPGTDTQERIAAPAGAAESTQNVALESQSFPVYDEPLPDHLPDRKNLLDTPAHTPDGEDQRRMEIDNGDDMDCTLDFSLNEKSDLLLKPEESSPSTENSNETEKSLIEDFADEAREHLEEVESSLLRLASDPANRELLDTIFRSMHTIKGASEYLGFERTARLSHRLENLLDLIREGQLQADKVTIDLLIDAQDRISDLVSQVETSGHETAEIDDLLDRVSVVSSESKTPDDEAEAAAVYEDETDKELFGIFIEQLSAGIGQLVETCGRLARKEAGPEAVDEMAGQVERLAATANYMGYDALSVIYEDLQAAITKFSSRSAYAGATEIEAFIQTSIVSGIDRIKELFPDVKPLPGTDTQERIAAPAGAAESTQNVALESQSFPVYDEPLPDHLPDRKNLLDTPAHTPDGEDQRRMEIDNGDDMDLWPRATDLTIPVVESLSVPAVSEVAMPAIGFSTSTTSESKTDEAPPAKEVATRSTIRKSIRVDAEKVDDLMNQVGELVVNRSSFAQLFNEMRELTNYLKHRFPMKKADQRRVSDLTGRLNEATTVLGRITGELQEQVMKVRMLPISRLFNRYPRLVHDLLKEADKKVQLQFRGEETELDRMVIEQLADPLIHMIRNAVDHGIEPFEDRIRKGKSESGVLLLEAYHEGSNVVIEVTDDGKGIDFSRIRQKAVEKKLADREALEQMDEQTLMDMIMLPGFSTADELTHTSGRGVGMDVVKRSIEKINGSLTADTRQDVGTRFRVKIPLTLAIIPAMMVKCGGSHFTVPMSAVEETLRIDQGEIFTVDGSELVHLHDAPLPLVRLTELLNMPVSVPSGNDDRLFVIVVKAAAGRTGFVVDSLLGRQETVVKPIEDYLQENSGFSGATILGDGSISLILDVDELAIMAREREAERKLAAAVL